jgi:hypothetical protein
VRKLLVFLLTLIAAVSFSSLAYAAENWDVTGTWKFNYEWLGSYYEHDAFLTQTGDIITGNGGFPVGGPYAYAWTITDGSITDDQIVLTMDYTVGAPGTTMHMTGTINPDGSILGNWDDNYPASTETTRESTWESSYGIAAFNRYGEILKPGEDEVEEIDLYLEAFLVDNDEDHISWAVRKGTCAMGTNTVLGNVDGHDDELEMTYIPEQYKYTYSGHFDISEFDGGMYCFIFNPTEDSGETNIRLTREFYIAEGSVHGGGQIIEEMGSKPKDDYKISFGGQVWDLGSEYMGDWEVNFHNVGDDDFDQTKFHTDRITAMNFYDTTNEEVCHAALNFTAYGWLGNDRSTEYRMIFRAGDYIEPGHHKTELDTIRVELYKGSSKIYDTYPTEFTPYENACVGSARTGLDKGNITIWHN